MTAWWEKASPGGPMVGPPFIRPLADCIIGPRISKNGYARFPAGKRGAWLYAHRAVWERTHGPIPAGAHIHHRCGVKACINIKHLELVPSFRDHMKLHPPQRQCDHDADRYIDSRGKSVCRRCTNAGQRRRYRERVGYV